MTQDLDVNPEEDTVGLFGSCDNHPWREPFIAKYHNEGVPFFNPVVPNWHPGMVPLEAWHLEHDPVILFPILKETYGIGSLSEVGLGPLRAYRQNFYRSFLILIDPEVTDELKEKDSAMAKASNRARALVRGHLERNKADNIVIVSTLEEMLEKSLLLWKAHKLLTETRPLRRSI